MKDRRSNLPVEWLIYFSLGLVTLAIYWPVIYHNFVEYDDQQYVVDNPVVQAGLTGHGFIWAFGFHAGNWHPLAWLSHMLDCQLYGTWAGGHHLTNVLLHVASTLLLFSVLNRMTGFRWRSAAVAALFAWHPLHVESVAWVSERKDVLCAFFWMLTLWFYVWYAAKSSPARYLAVLGSFGLCLMAKPMAVTLPFVLLLLDYWPMNRFLGFASPPPAGPPVFFIQRSWRQLVLEKIPLLVLTAIACKLTLSAQELAIVSTAGLPVFQRLVHVWVAYSHYVVAMFIPCDLAVYYPYNFHLAPLNILGAVGLLVLVTIMAFIHWRTRPWLAMGWLWFLGTLVPVIGLVQVGDQDWADRYTYLPLIGLFIPVVWAVSELIKSRLILQGITVIVGAGLLLATTTQLSHWQNTRTLFEHTNQVTRNNALAITILGSLLAKEGKLDQAMDDYRTALRYRPSFPEAHFFMGSALDEQGKLDEALAEYQQALWFRPTAEQTHIFMGIVLAKQKKYDEAIAHYDAALKLNPDSAATENNLARIFHTRGQLDLAIEHYTIALKIDPKLSLAHNNLGILLIQQGNLVAGTQHLRVAVKLRPDNAESKYNLALALNQQGKWDEAAGLFEKVQGTYAANPKAHYEYGRAFEHLKKSREAMSQYAATLLIQTDYAEALDRLAWILSTDNNPAIRNGTEAVQLAEQACTLTGHQDPEKLKTLAVADAETGRFGEAIKVLQTAKDLANKTNHPELVSEYPFMLEQFQQARGWRSP